VERTLYAVALARLARHDSSTVLAMQSSRLFLLSSLLLAPGLAACSGETAKTGAAGASPTSAPAAATPASAPAQAQPAAKDALTAMREFIAARAIDRGKPGWKVALPRPPKLEFDLSKTYLWHLQTSEGPIVVRLMPDIAPMHVSSTIYLSELGFYDGLKFHRVIPNFMAQGGCPLGSGTGNPGYKYEGEFSPKARHDRPGLLSMANGGPGTDGSQFFLTFVPYPSLDDKHTIFGEVVEGMENLRKLEASGSPSGKTKKPLLIDTAKVVVK
jgi:peptidyl-prolyl cis-trans isomerase B (cyclophilin B)